MTDPNLGKLLSWAVRNSDANEESDHSDTAPRGDPGRGLDAETLKALMGGPSDADLMRQSMAAVQSAEVDLENKLVAFDNFEQLIETIDNANNMENLNLWVPLVAQLDSHESELRRMAAWCVGTAVQNNPRAQGRALALHAVPKLVKLALTDDQVTTRKKAVYALSSQVRNYQPGFDEALQHLPAQYKGNPDLDANDMDAVDSVINKLREDVSKPR